MGSKKILMISTDPEAPIIAKADYAVSGDLHGVIPAICDELRKKLIRRLAHLWDII